MGAVLMLILRRLRMCRGSERPGCPYTMMSHSSLKVDFPACVCVISSCAGVSGRSCLTAAGDRLWYLPVICCATSP